MRLDVMQNKAIRDRMKRYRPNVAEGMRQTDTQDGALILALIFLSAKSKTSWKYRILISDYRKHLDIRIC